MTAMNISANEITLRTCSDPSMYWVSQILAGAVNRAETQTPAMMEMMAMTCDMNPLRRPCTRAGTKQIKRMISDAKKVVSSHSKGESSFLCNEIPDLELLKEAIRQTGYEVKDISWEEYKKKWNLFG